MVNEIHKWFEYIQQPRIELGKQSICPFAKTVTDTNQYSIDECGLDTIIVQVANANTIDNKVCIFYLPNYLDYTIEALEQKTKYLNEQYVPLNKVVLDSDPRTPFNLNGIVTNFPDCYIWIVQPLDDLNLKSDKLMNSTTYYDQWSQEQLDEVVTWRYNYNRHETGE